MKKLCPICLTWFSRPKGKSNKVWLAQKCCGTDCSAISRRHAEDTRGRRKQLTPGNRRYGSNRG